MAANASLENSEGRKVKVDSLEDTTVAELITDVLARQRIPGATYRLQFHAGFTLRQAEALVSYLNELGITDCYASPLFKARTGSLHGYDICDHSQLNPEIGSEMDFEAFADALRNCGIGLILDVVPNHMSISSENAWWLDVLETGPSSPFAGYFDIDWHPVRPDLENKVLLPILEDQYGKVLEGGKLRLLYEDGAFSIHYYDTKLPLAPRTYTRILEKAMEKLDQVLERQNEHLQELLSILTALSYLPPRTEVSPVKIEERFREKEIIKRRIVALYGSCSNVRSAIEETVQTFNGVVGEPHSFDQLDALIDAQPYRPAFWRVATEEINYRRFFDINDLAAIRVEIPEVFEDTHRLLFRLLAEGRITGLRIDHPDGLWDPPSYFRRIQENYLLHLLHPVLGQEPPEQQEQCREALSTWLEQEISRAGARRWPLYVVAEKILSEGESLPSDWAVHGTTGYDFLNDLNGLFVEGNNRGTFDKVYRDFIGSSVNFNSLINSTKKMIMLVSMAGEMNALAHQLDRISEKNRWYRDFTLNSLTFALREVIGCLPIYRTYVSQERVPSAQERGCIQRAVAEARRRNPRTAKTVFDFIEQTLLLENARDFLEKDRPALTDFVMKVQQITGPVMAKGVEDTAFYIFNRLVSLNEVGGNPARFGISVEQFHHENIRRLQSWPHSLLATSTHDTKRGEDVRARINVLSEIPKEWKAALKRWTRFNRAKKTSLHGALAPDFNDEYLFYQTLIGAWPPQPMGARELEAFRERITAYMLKATREAKVHTSWINPDEEYDGAVQRFVREVLTESKRNRFLKDFQAFQQRVAAYGWTNALAQLLLKLTSPGVPDIYQGSELWNFSLVDPDNRRPVDYDHRRALLKGLKEQLLLVGEDFTVLTRQLVGTPEDGRVKLYLTYQVMNYRRSHQDLFSRGTYTPLFAIGEKARHVCAFMRKLQEEIALIAVPRLLVGLTDGDHGCLPDGNQWRDTSLVLPGDATGRVFRNLLTGERVRADSRNGKPAIPLAAVFQFFPVALLQQDSLAGLLQSEP